jgi:WD40 repeat protein
VARLWSLPDGKPVREIGASSKPLRVVAYGPAGGLVLTAGDDGVARIWELGPQPVAELRHGPGIRSAAFSVDGSFVATAGSDRFVRIWSTRSGRRMRTLDQEGSSTR